MAATAMSAFFRQNGGRFDNVETFVSDWTNPAATTDLKDYCTADQRLAHSLREIVPADMHDATGLAGDAWMQNIAGSDSRLSRVEAEVCADFRAMAELRKRYFDEGKDYLVARIGRRVRTIASERTLTFSRARRSFQSTGFRWTWSNSTRAPRTAIPPVSRSKGICHRLSPSTHPAARSLQTSWSGSHAE